MEGEGEREMDKSKGRSLSRRVQSIDNIIIFKRNKLMSYYTLLPNYYSGCLPQTPYSCPSPVSKSLQLLPILAQALKTSIFQYSASQLSAALNTPSAPIPQEKMPLPPVQEAVVRVRSEEMNQRNQNLKGEEKENIQQKTAILKGSEEKHNQNSSQHITSEEIRQEEGELLPTKKQGDLRLLNKKEKVRPKKDLFEVPIPTLNLLETADLPVFTFSSEQAARKRESLLQRQVDTWNEKAKNRRDKREIRMLNN